MTARRPLLLLGLLALACSACGDKAPPKSKTEPEAKTEPETKAEPVPAASTSGGTTGGTTGDPFDTEGWGEDDTGEATMGLSPGTGTGGTGTGGTGEEPTVPLYAGPCFVRWSKGPILRFKYDKDGGGGRLRIDGDNDGKSDVCARFWTKDDRTNKVSVDEGCDKSTDAIIVPTYEEGTNIATATYTDKRGNAEAKHEITLLTLPAFTGIAPGYPLYAKRDDVSIKQKDGRVTQATVKSPVEGPAVKVKLKYDGEGRVTRIEEDHEADGKIDRRFDYRYDDVGNVTGMTLTESDYSEGKRKKSKKTAKLGYRCWAE